MNWIEIIINILANLIIGFIVFFSYQASKEITRNHPGWPGYKRILTGIGLASALLIVYGYMNLPPLYTTLSGKQKSFIVEMLFTISIPALIGVFVANRKAKEFYSDISNDNITLYQSTFNKILHSVDTTNNTNWAHSKSYDKELLARDDALIEQVIAEANSSGINSVYIKMIVYQFFFADVLERENDKAAWVSKVLNRNDLDYFPDPWSLYKMLKK